MLLVLALGGNAISSRNERGDIPDQIKQCSAVAESIVNLVLKGYKVAVTYGNGPQVGNIIWRVEACRDFLYGLPLDVCVAHSQGGISYILKREIDNKFRQFHMDKTAVSIVSQTLVDPGDSAFSFPTKPIGPFYSKEKIEILQKELNWDIVEDSNRGWRRVVPSPRPVNILEQNHIEEILKYSDVVICCGGGGIPVALKNNQLVGIEGVIDKDFTSSLLAQKLRADLFIITTDIDKVKLKYGTPEETELDEMDVEEARYFYRKGEFPTGSMGPKIEAAIDFVTITGNDVLITLPEDIQHAIKGKRGTRIYRRNIRKMHIEHK